VLGQQPGERDLCFGGADPVGDAVEQIDDGLVRRRASAPKRGMELGKSPACKVVVSIVPVPLTSSAASRDGYAQIGAAIRPMRVQIKSTPR